MTEEVTVSSSSSSFSSSTNSQAPKRRRPQGPRVLKRARISPENYSGDEMEDEARAKLEAENPKNHVTLVFESLNPIFCTHDYSTIATQLQEIIEQLAKQRVTPPVTLPSEELPKQDFIAGLLRITQELQRRIAYARNPLLNPTKDQLANMQVTLTSALKIIQIDKNSLVAHACEQLVAIIQENAHQTEMLFNIILRIEVLLGQIKSSGLEEDINTQGLLLIRNYLKVMHAMQQIIVRIQTSHGAIPLGKIIYILHGQSIETIDIETEKSPKYIDLLIAITTRTVDEVIGIMNTQNHKFKRVYLTNHRQITQYRRIIAMINSLAEALGLKTRLLDTTEHLDMYEQNQEEAQAVSETNDRLRILKEKITRLLAGIQEKTNIPISRIGTIARVSELNGNMPTHLTLETIQEQFNQLHQYHTATDSTVNHALTELFVSPHGFTWTQVDTIVENLFLLTESISA